MSDLENQLEEIRHEVERWIKANKKKVRRFYQRKKIKEKIHDALLSHIPELDDFLTGTGMDIVKDALSEVFAMAGSNLTPDQKALIFESVMKEGVRYKAMVLKQFERLIERVF